MNFGLYLHFVYTVQVSGRLRNLSKIGLALPLTILDCVSRSPSARAPSLRRVGVHDGDACREGARVHHGVCVHGLHHAGHGAAAVSFWVMCPCCLK